jgi:hypothetical protein
MIEDWVSKIDVSEAINLSSSYAKNQLIIYQTPKAFLLYDQLVKFLNYFLGFF